MKVVLNRKYGGFSLSDQALEMLANLKGIPKKSFDLFRVRRTDKFLIQVVEQLGDAAGFKKGQLKIHHIPDGIKWSLRDTDGIEWAEWPVFGGGLKMSYLIPGNE